MPLADYTFERMPACMGSNNNNKELSPFLEDEDKKRIVISSQWLKTMPTHVSKELLAEVAKFKSQGWDFSISDDLGWPITPHSAKLCLNTGGPTDKATPSRSLFYRFLHQFDVHKWFPIPGVRELFDPLADTHTFSDDERAVMGAIARLAGDLTEKRLSDRERKEPFIAARKIYRYASRDSVPREPALRPRWPGELVPKWGRDTNRFAYSIQEEAERKIMERYAENLVEDIISSELEKIPVHNLLRHELEVLLAIKIEKKAAGLEEPLATEDLARKLLAAIPEDKLGPLSPFAAELLKKPLTAANFEIALEARMPVFMKWFKTKFAAHPGMPWFVRASTTSAKHSRPTGPGDIHPHVFPSFTIWDGLFKFWDNKQIVEDLCRSKEDIPTMAVYVAPWNLRLSRSQYEVRVFVSDGQVTAWGAQGAGQENGKWFKTSEARPMTAAIGKFMDERVIPVFPFRTFVADVWFPNAHLDPEIPRLKAILGDRDRWEPKVVEFNVSADGWNAAVSTSCHWLAHRTELTNRERKIYAFYHQKAEDPPPAKKSISTSSTSAAGATRSSSGTK